MANMYELCRLAGSKLILPKCAETEYEWGRGLVPYLYYIRT